MNKIIVKNQEEFDRLPDKFRNYTEIQVRGNLDRIDRTFINAEINLYDLARVEYMSGSARVGYMYDFSRIGFMLDSTQVGHMSDSAQVGSMSSSTRVGYMYDLAQVINMFDSAQIECMSNLARVEYMSDLAQVKNMYSSAQIISMHKSTQVINMSDSAQVGSMYNSARVEHMYNTSQVRWMYDLAQVGHIFGSAQIKSMSSSAQIRYMSMNSTAKILSADVIIHEARQNAILVIISYIKSAGFNLNNFIRGYDVKTENNKLVLYKFVQKDYTDFYTGKIKYEIGTIVKCPDWDSNVDRECGGGLHVSPSIEFCKIFDNSEDGHALKVLVDLKDIIVHPNPQYPYKIRCKQLEVLEEIEE